MYKILNTKGLGVAGRQNELIELALTHGFSGVEVDITDLVGRHDALGKEFACQFLQSAKIDMGTFCLPADLGGTDEEFEASIANLEIVIDLAKTLNANRCYVNIEPKSETRAFQENFEIQQKRLQALGEKLEPAEIRLGVALQASTVETATGEFKFIQTADEILTLVKTVGQSNVGLCLDAWEWVAGGGTLEQLDGFDPKLVTELRLSDVPAGTDVAKITSADRTRLPGDSEGSFSVKLAKQLVAAGYDGSVSASTSLATFTGGSRDSIVGKLSKNLDIIIAGEDPFVPVEAPEPAEGEAAAGEEAPKDEASADAKPAAAKAVAAGATKS